MASFFGPEASRHASRVVAGVLCRAPLEERSTKFSPAQAPPNPEKAAGEPQRGPLCLAGLSQSRNHPLNRLGPGPRSLESVAARRARGGWGGVPWNEPPTGIIGG